MLGNKVLLSLSLSINFVSDSGIYVQRVGKPQIIQLVCGPLQFDKPFRYIKRPGCVGLFCQLEDVLKAYLRVSRAER